jgi:hypothetical protein
MTGAAMQEIRGWMEPRLTFLARWAGNGRNAWHAASPSERIPTLVKAVLWRSFFMRAARSHTAKRIVRRSSLALELETRTIKRVSDILSFRVNGVEARTDKFDIVAFALSAFHPDGEKTLEV